MIENNEVQNKQLEQNLIKQVEINKTLSHQVAAYKSSIDELMQSNLSCKTNLSLLQDAYRQVMAARNQLEEQVKSLNEKLSSLQPPVLAEPDGA